ncbi:hypothetical protein J5U23_00709 [Saccharolobus shibatae B12]|uniref:Uncharacterized protein n=1 Tax=Saccharolobus shibatae (strain ATCC 51178 / DSM 5389 / JCM 8931 / NBRC 15437 / B12) TaxID=523848 RepID=A0A8F5GSK5_SACSH|nr:hypothetical protein J5U23_00709 [Saccharolobus shibatae B12]
MIEKCEVREEAGHCQSDFIKSFNSLAGILEMKGLSRKVEEFLRFVEKRLGGALGLMKTFKLR